jgi:hypothetical protein
MAFPPVLSSTTMLIPSPPDPQLDEEIRFYVAQEF